MRASTHRCLVTLQSIWLRLTNDKVFEFDALRQLLKPRLTFRKTEERIAFADGLIDFYSELVSLMEAGLKVESDQLQSSIALLIKKLSAFHKGFSTAKTKIAREKNKAIDKKEVDQTNVKFLRKLRGHRKFLDLVAGHIASKPKGNKVIRILGIRVKIGILKKVAEGVLRLTESQVDYIIETQFPTHATEEKMISMARAADSRTSNGKPAVARSSGTTASLPGEGDVNEDDNDYQDEDGSDDEG